MKKIAITGASGQLGTDLVKYLEPNNEYEIFSLTRALIDCGDKDLVFDVLADIGPDIVINCAAYVRVDDCEDSAEQALRVNTLGAANVAKACSINNSICMYISTDYVFDGKNVIPYTEEDMPGPLNVYGISKLSGEYAVRAYCPRHFIVRSSGLYGHAGSSGKGGNFVETMLNLAQKNIKIKVVNDQVLTPTFTNDLAKSVIDLIGTEHFGTYHITNSGECSWYLFAKEIFRISNMTPEYEPVCSKEYGARAKRPAYSVLSNKKLSDTSIAPPRTWREALEEYISLRP